MALRQLLPNANPPIRLIALHWLTPDVSKAEFHRICATRITARGDNHQTLRASEDAASAHEEILWRFISTSEDLAEAEVDEIIEMDIRDDTEAAVRRAVSGLCKTLGLERPSEDAIRDAINVSQGYTVPSTSKRAMNLPASSKARDNRKGNPRYFGITPSANAEWQLNTIINSELSGLSDNDEHSQLLQLWKTLTDDQRVTEHPHITLVHQASLKSGSEKGAKRLWEACSESNRDVSVKFRLSHLIYNSRIMALVAEPASFSESSSPQFSEILKAMDPSTLERLHITVGTANSSVKPVEAGELVLKWRQQKLKPEEGGAIPLSNNDLLSGNVEGLWS
jgi:tRNA ligase